MIWALNVKWVPSLLVFLSCGTGILSDKSARFEWHDRFSGEAGNCDKDTHIQCRSDGMCNDGKFFLEGKACPLRCVTNGVPSVSHLHYRLMLKVRRIC